MQKLCLRFEEKPRLLVQYHNMTKKDKQQLLES